MRTTLKAVAIGAALIAVPNCAPLDGSSEPPEEALSNAPLDSDEPVGSAQQGITVSGMGHYCSMTWASGGWAFSSNTTGGDPCGDIIAGAAPGGTIQRAGVYSAAGTNRVVARCNGFANKYSGTGNAPLTSAYNWALGKSGCIFTVAPKSMPIFDRPYPANITPTAGTGIDFAWVHGTPGFTLNPSAFGQSPGGAFALIDWKGRGKTDPPFINNHDAHDWGMARGTPVLAVADGVVRRARWADTHCMDNGTCPSSDGQIHGEVYIDHTVTRSPSTYNEKFTSGYFHLQVLAVVDGQTVTKGQVIGQSGNLGPSSGPHLHFAVMRLTNTSSYYQFPLAINATDINGDGIQDAGNTGWETAIEPYGWDAPEGFDPRGYNSFPYGALSINLWSSGQAPPTGDW